MRGDDSVPPAGTARGILGFLTDPGKPNPAAIDDALVPLYRELRELAHGVLGGVQPGQTLQPTAIVHEAWLRLAGNKQLAWNSRTHFFAISAKAMRAVLVDHLRRTHAQKRGGGQAKVTLIGVEATDGPGIEVLALHEALEELQALDPRQADIVEQRFFAGLSVEEVAEQLGVSERTVKNDWRMAKAWLRAKLDPRD